VTDPASKQLVAYLADAPAPLGSVRGKRCFGGAA